MIILGVILQSWLLVGIPKKTNLLKTLIIFSISLLVLGLFKQKLFEDKSVSLLIFFYICIFSEAFRNEALPVINEKVLVSYLTLLGYVLVKVSVLMILLWADISLIMPIAVVMGLLFWRVFSSRPFGVAEKFLAYTFFLVLLVLVQTASFLTQEALIEQDRMRGVSNWELILWGMSILYSSFYIYQLLSLIPIPSKTQSFYQKWKDVKSQVKLFVKKYSDKQAQKIELLFLVLLQGLIYWANERWQLYSFLGITSLSIVVIPQLSAHLGKH